MTHLLHIIGYFLIWVAINHKRNEDSIKLGTKDWLYLLFLIVVAGLLLGQ